MGRRKRKQYIPYDYEKAFANNIKMLHEYFVKQMLAHNRKYVYALKEILSGEQLEVEIYPEFTKAEDIPKEGQIRKDNSAAQKKLNDKNARKYVERLLNQNFGNSDIWITLTYSKGNEPKSWAEAIRNMQNYMKRIAYRRKKKGLPRAKYIYITEHSPDEKIRWHHHLVMDGMLDMDTVEMTWKKGRRNETRRLNKDEHGLVGMSRYITKEKVRKKGEKRWSSSKGLLKPHIKKVYSKPSVAGKGSYKPIERYVDGFVRDQEAVREQMAKWYPGYIYTESEIFYNDFNRMFYIHARMRKGAG